MFIDTHFHVSLNDNIDEIIKDAADNETKKLIVSICEKHDQMNILKLISKYENIYVTIGYHPGEADNVTEQDLIELEDIIINDSKVVGMGEIGLDYHYESANKDRQKELFIRQLKIAERLNIPVVIHSRDAFSDTYQILSNYKVKGIIHCFSGSLETAEAYIKLGYLLGIGGVVTFSNSNLKETLKHIPVENLVLETDSPYLSPIRGTTNSPKNIKLVAKKISEIYNIDIREIAKITSRNATVLFDLKNK